MAEFAREYARFNRIHNFRLEQSAEHPLAKEFNTRNFQIHKVDGFLLPAGAILFDAIKVGSFARV
jgi:hypothetical protein